MAVAAAATTDFPSQVLPLPLPSSSPSPLLYLLFLPFSFTTFLTSSVDTPWSALLSELPLHIQKGAQM